jgi:hypothetical protein
MPGVESRSSTSELGSVCNIIEFSANELQNSKNGEFLGVAKALDTTKRQFGGTDRHVPVFQTPTPRNRVDCSAKKHRSDFPPANGENRVDQLRIIDLRMRLQTILIITSTLPRVALEYGQFRWASSTTACVTAGSIPGTLTLSRALRK